MSHYNYQCKINSVVINNYAWTAPGCMLQIYIKTEQIAVTPILNPITYIIMFIFSSSRLSFLIILLTTPTVHQRTVPEPTLFEDTSNQVQYENTGSGGVGGAYTNKGRGFSILTVLLATNHQQKEILFKNSKTA